VLYKLHKKGDADGWAKFKQKLSDSRLKWERKKGRKTDPPWMSLKCVDCPHGKLVSKTRISQE
jgi:hypothetical protein